MYVVRKDVVKVTAKTLERIISSNDVKISLANLRRGVNRNPGEIPQILNEFLRDMPEAMYGVSGQISHAEWAIYIALTLYATHQQGNDLKKERMYSKGEDYWFGSAVAQLAKDEDDFRRVLRRINIVLTSNSLVELRRHIFSLVQLLRVKKIPLDYANLAGDIYSYQNIESRNYVRLKWGRDFYRTYDRNHKKNGEVE